MGPKRFVNEFSMVPRIRFCSLPHRLRRLLFGRKELARLRWTKAGGNYEMKKGDNDPGIRKVVTALIPLEIVYPRCLNLTPWNNWPALP